MAFNRAMRRTSPMPLTIPTHKAEQRLLGQALRAVRESRRPKPSLRDIGQALDMTGANYQQYELGERSFTQDKLDAILTALGATEAEVESERAKILGEDAQPANENRTAGDPMVVEIYARAMAGPLGTQVRDIGEPLRQIDLRQILGRNVGATEVGGESMIPWAEPGEIVLFDRGRHPRRGYGCVIETKEGDLFVKLYSHQDGSTLFVKELYPEEKTITFPLATLKGVYAVRLRGD